MTQDGCTLMTDKASALMVVSHVTLDYDEQDDTTRALDDVSLTIDEGDFVCMLGPSGCGKSTLLNIMAGLLEPTRGEVTFRGKDAGGVDYRRAVIFQQPVLYPWMSTYGNIAFGPRVRDVDKDEIKRRVDKYIDLVGLTEFAERPPYELSGGMRQRAALARELVNDPNMILLDEPFGALDALTRVNMQGLVRDIWDKDGRTVFLITHDVDEALMLGTRVLVMSSRPGRVVREVACDYVRSIESGDKDVVYSESYLRLRREILEIISSR